MQPEKERQGPPRAEIEGVPAVSPGCPCRDCARTGSLAGQSVAGYETFFSMTVAHLMHRLAEFDPDAVVSLRMEHGKQVWYKHVRQVRRHASEPGYPPRPDDPILCVSSYSIGVECDRCRGVVVDEAPGLFDE